MPVEESSPTSLGPRANAIKAKPPITEPTTAPIKLPRDILDPARASSLGGLDTEPVEEVSDAGSVVEVWVVELSVVELRMLVRRVTVLILAQQWLARLTRVDYHAEAEFDVGHAGAASVGWYENMAVPVGLTIEKMVDTTI
ncbi:unnamed protein product [Clonostachys rosea f. rosea IK726]|uniref:Uncharacterized protein n=1 Tax=Clonostachys rosea f. rosea IK726 TaxID=1349383 RepID=A0ACA9U9K0_BIOOC|nr:unnamed protein product [Clonostachys rosea f. rosea IK726]